MEKPWPVYVLDHHGVEHYVEMRPGDMVLYEGASCSHGREQPLVGDWFANVRSLRVTLGLDPRFVIRPVSTITLSKPKISRGNVRSRGQGEV